MFFINYQLFLAKIGIFTTLFRVIINKLQNLADQMTILKCKINSFAKKSSQLLILAYIAF